LGGFRDKEKTAFNHERKTKTERFLEEGKKIL